MSELAVLVVSRNRPDLVQEAVENIAACTSVPYDLYVVECGTTPEQMSPHSTHWFADPDFRGKCFGHNVALQAARLTKKYRYYWVLMNDVRFQPAQDTAAALIRTLEQNPQMAIVSPTEPGDRYPGGNPRPGSAWRPITTCDYLALMVRGLAIEEVGFLNPDFRYCWGAIHELSFHLYAAGWFLAYDDTVQFHHLGGTTYGNANTQTISRAEYQRSAARFAFDHMVSTYGWEWAARFWEAARQVQPGIEVNTYERHFRMWAQSFTPQELAERRARAGVLFPPRPEATASAVPAALIAQAALATATTTLTHTDGSMNHNIPTSAFVPTSSATAAPAGDVASRIASWRAAGQPVRLHLGAGAERREGWLNVDLNPATRPDIVASVEALPMVPDASVDEIEAHHLFEHLTYTQATTALQEWRRILRPGGTLSLELPNMEACIRLLGQHFDAQGHDLAMVGLYGWPPDIDREGTFQTHKWGWTPATLTRALQTAGFGEVTEQPVTQGWRPAAKLGRDMRLVAAVPQPVTAVPVEATFAEPWAITSASTVNILLWPDYRRAADLRYLREAIAPRFTSLDATLLLRVDPQVDGSVADIYDLLGEIPARIGFVTGTLAPEDYPALAARIDGILVLPASVEPKRAAFLDGLGSPILQLLPANAESPAAEPEAPVQARPDTAALEAEIRALDPWFYPLVVGGVQVMPGTGSGWSAEKLSNRIRCRQTLMVDEVVRRYDFTHKAVLELACNCGYWSSRYVAHGANRVVGVEGREKYVQQAELFWRTEGILPRDQYRFLQGNVLSAELWTRLRQQAPFDVSVCAGLLYHLPEYRQLLAWMAAVTRDVMIIDTRVQSGPEVIITEPGELHFNAIEETRDKIVPNFKQLVAHIHAVGFVPERLVPSFESPDGLRDVDDYNLGNRVTIFARRRTA